MPGEQTTLGDMHEKRFNKHFTTNPLVIPITGEGFNPEDIKLLKEIMRDGFCAIKERKNKSEK